jgi:protein-S-isoprenylcysteine O-methyltransferase Ste14
LTIASLVISFALLSAVIDKEEKYLKARFGAEFEAYSRRVRRWI